MAEAMGWDSELVLYPWLPLTPGTILSESVLTRGALSYLFRLQFTKTHEHVLNIKLADFLSWDWWLQFHWGRSNFLFWVRTAEKWDTVTGHQGAL